jgi:hypothetical protein
MTSKLEPANLFSTEGMYYPAETRCAASDQCCASIAGLVAVITGGGTGIGLMMATALENNGATVYIIGRRYDSLGVISQS